MFFVIFNAALTALNAGLYAADPNPWSLGGAIFCGLMTLVILVAEVAQ